MEDIAGAAGVGRPTVFRFFRSKDKLIDGVILHQLRELTDGLQPLIYALDTLVEAVVEGSVLLVEAARANVTLSALVMASTAAHVSHMLLHPSGPAHATAMDLWHPILERARRRGEVREDLVDDDLVEWLSGLHLVFWLDPDLDVDHMQDLLTLFLAPALHPHAAPEPP